MNSAWPPRLPPRIGSNILLSESRKRDSGHIVSHYLLHDVHDDEDPLLIPDDFRIIVLVHTWTNDDGHHVRTLNLQAFFYSTHATLPSLSDGETVVEFITTDAQGDSTTSILYILCSVSKPSSELILSRSTMTGTSTTAATTADDVPQGPVGQPGATATGTNPTPYTYTTLVDGVLTAIADTFTPTFPASQSPTTAPSGSILDYSQWLSIYGPPPSSSSSAQKMLRVGNGAGWLGVMLSVFCSAIAGIWLVRL